MALTDKLTNIADAIRGKTGGTEAMTLDQMAEAIAGIAAGGGSGVAIQTGSFTPASQPSSAPSVITVQTNGKCSNFAVWRVSTELVAGQRTLQRYVEVDRSPAAMSSFYFSLSSNSGGTSINTTAYGEGSQCTFADDGVTIKIWHTTAGYGYFATGYEYQWMAW